jgi:nucleotide-binding universal stress UspA family protein
MFKRVLIPTDGSVVSRRAVKAGVALAKELGAKVTAYHALEVSPPYAYQDGYIVGHRAIKQMEEKARETARKHLAEVEKAAQAAGVTCESIVTNPSAPYRGIVDTARKKRCDVIFMASHGRGEFASLLLGSVTQKVLAHSKVPVLVYR